MITRYGKSDSALYTRLYRVEERFGTPYLVLDSVDIDCLNCNKVTHVDFRMVPVCQIEMKCVACDSSLFLIEEEDFEYELEVSKRLTLKGAAAYSFQIGRNPTEEFVL